MSDISDLNAQTSQQSEDKQGRQMAYVGLGLFVAGFLFKRFSWWLWIGGAALAIAGYNRINRAGLTYDAYLVQKSQGLMKA